MRVSCNGEVMGERTVKVPDEESTQETLADLGEVPLVEEERRVGLRTIRV